MDTACIGWGQQIGGTHAHLPAAGPPLIGHRAAPSTALPAPPAVGASIPPPLHQQMQARAGAWSCMAVRWARSGGGWRIEDSCHMPHPPPAMLAQALGGPGLIDTAKASAPPHAPAAQPAWKPHGSEPQVLLAPLRAAAGGGEQRPPPQTTTVGRGAELSVASVPSFYI